MRLRDLSRLPGLALVVAALVAASTLGAGLVMDDVLTRARLLGFATAWGASPWWDVFTFARPDLNAGLRDAGLHPWWSDPAVKMVFFRPLSAATHVLDYALWPDAPALHHVHSALWYVLAVLVAGALVRRVHTESPGLARLAALLFAVAAPHVATVGWVASRNTLIAFVIGGCVIGLHARAGLGARIAAVVALVVGLLASEATLGALGYVLAWQLCLDARAWPRRLAALAPYAIVIALWRLLYVAGGFGSAATSCYHDPSADLVDFLRAVATNLPALLGTRLLLLPVDGWAFAPAGVRVGLSLIGAAATVAIAWLLWPRLRADPRARFWALGATLSLIPFTATLPMDRLVLFAGLGWSALLADLAFVSPRRRWARRAGAVLLALHLPVSAAFGVARGLTLGPSLSAFSGGYEQAPRDARVPAQTFVYVTGTFHRVHYMTLMRLTRGEPAVPRRSVVLSSMVSDVSVTRTDARTLELAPSGGFMITELDRIHRGDPTTLAVGDTVRLPDLEIEVLERTPDGRPSRAAFRFHAPLEHGSLRWLAVVADQPSIVPLDIETRAFTPPAIGETVIVPGVLRPSP
ncbi:MAG: hypothetical protein H6713_15180 [Myxococcales bacterium]|nr:hypothetical protein [Myxococcales bacterium]MCB9751318.1 hypothetical protein [Myxococcales bacterium]